MKIFIYYDFTVEEEHEVDVAAVRARSRKEAVKILERYYSSVSLDKIRELDFKNYEGEDTNIMIISDY